MKTQWNLILRIVNFALMALALIAPAGRAQVKPCCAITALDAHAATATAKENGTSRTFVFKVTDAKLFATIRVGTPVYANFSTKQVSLDGKSICCIIVATKPMSSGVSPQSAPTPPNSGTNPACCAITSINAPARVVTAKENSTGQGFEFAVPSSIPIQSLHVAQSVWANFKARKVSLDGQTACCDLTSVGTTANAGSASGEQVPQPGPAQSAPAPSAPVAAALNAKTTSPYKIETFGVFAGPVPGGQNNAGTVTLTAPVDASPAVIELSTDNPQVATVPATVKISTGNLASVVVTTFGVKEPVEVNLKAQIRGASDVFTSKMTVRPAQLSILDCSPNQFPSGAPIHCKLWLDGKTPPLQSKDGKLLPNTQQIQIQITTDKPALAFPQTVTVGSGTDKAEFNLPTIADAQGGPIKVIASFEGVTKSATVQLTQAMIKDFGCFVGDSALSAAIQGATACALTPWSGRPYGLIVHLTQARAQQVSIQVTEPGRLHHWSSDAPNMLIPADQAWGGVWYDGGDWSHGGYFEPVPKTENHTVFVRDQVSGVTHSVTFTVLPARIVGIGFGDTQESAQNPATITSLPGQKLRVWVSFDSPPAPTDWQSENAWLDIQYGASTDPNQGNFSVQGPTNTAIQEQICTPPRGPVDNGFCQVNFYNLFVFEITVGACSTAENPNGCQATVKVSSNQALGSQLGILNVIPQ
jgi:hypothetical protein